MLPAVIRAQFVSSVVSNGFCDASAQSQIVNCARELTQLGLFNTNNIRAGQPSNTFDVVRSQSKDYFQQICR